MLDHLLSGLQIDCLELDDPSVGVGHLLVHVDVQHHSTDLGKNLFSSTEMCMSKVMESICLINTFW